MDKKLYMYFSIIIIILCTHEKEHAIWAEKTTGASIYLSIFRPRLFVLFFFSALHSSKSSPQYKFRMSLPLHIKTVKDNWFFDFWPTHHAPLSWCPPRPLSGCPWPPGASSGSGRGCCSSKCRQQHYRPTMAPLVPPLVPVLAGNSEWHPPITIWSSHWDLLVNISITILKNTKI